jgi:hypothetical protein
MSIQTNLHVEHNPSTAAQRLTRAYSPEAEILNSFLSALNFKVCCGQIFKKKKKGVLWTVTAMWMQIQFSFFFFFFKKKMQIQLTLLVTVTAVQLGLVWRPARHSSSCFQAPQYRISRFFPLTAHCY